MGEVNKVFLHLLSFIVGMMLFIPTFSHLQSENHKYPFVGEVMLYPKHPVIECQKNDECRILSESAYYEARSQSDEGVLAMMQTVLNRVNHSRWGDTIREVVYDGCNFSYVCDGSVGRRKVKPEQWERMNMLAYALLTGKVVPPVSKSTHYHTKKVAPSWRKHYTVVGVVDDHIFYECKRRC